MTMPRMRTIPKAAAEIREMDPETALTEKGLRRLVKQGRIPAVAMESRLLVDLNKVCEYLASPSEEEPAPTIAGIHPVPLELRRKA